MISRFMALLRKELRESLPLMSATFLLFVVFSTYSIRITISQGANDYIRHQNIQAGQFMGLFYLFHGYYLHEMAFWIQLTAVFSGLGLGIVHFGVPSITRTWSFLIHRSTKRLSILTAKFLTALITFVLAIGIVWCWVYWYSQQIRLSSFPPHHRVLVEGWIYLAMGCLVYLATALSALNAARWYASKFAPFGFVFLVYAAVVTQGHIPTALMIQGLGIGLLLIQLAHTFNTKAF